MPTEQSNMKSKKPFVFFKLLKFATNSERVPLNVEPLFADDPIELFSLRSIWSWGPRI